MYSTQKQGGHAPVKCGQIPTINDACKLGKNVIIQMKDNGQVRRTTQLPHTYLEATNLMAHKVTNSFGLHQLFPFLQTWCRYPDPLAPPIYLLLGVFIQTNICYAPASVQL